MSFDKLEQTELLKIAEEFGVEVDVKAKPADLVTALEEDGVTWELARQTVMSLGKRFDEVDAVVEKEKKKAKAAEPKILVKCERQNASYQVRGHTFTKEAPFALMAESDALFVVKNVEGFRRADPAEAAEFYG